VDNRRSHAVDVKTRLSSTGWLPRSTLGRTTLSLLVLDWFMLVAAGVSKARRKRAHRHLVC